RYINSFLRMEHKHNNFYKITTNFKLPEITDDAKEEAIKDNTKDKNKGKSNSHQKSKDDANSEHDEVINKNLPCFPTTKGMRISSQFGNRDDPLNAGQNEFHWGLDISGGGVTHPLYAMEGGTVVANNLSETGGYMIYVKV